MQPFGGYRQRVAHGKGETTLFGDHRGSADRRRVRVWSDALDATVHRPARQGTIDLSNGAGQAQPASTSEDRAGFSRLPFWVRLTLKCIPGAILLICREHG